MAASNAGSFVPRVMMLLNLKNGVELVDRPAPEKLNFARAKKGKVPLFSYKVVSIRMPRRMRRNEERPPSRDEEHMRLHWVRGHIKVRKGGIFWWSHHLRGDPEQGFSDKDYKFT